MRVHKVLHGCDLDDIQTWIRYRKGMCDSCRASCCTMPVEVRLPDLVRIGIVDEFELDADPRQIAKRLQKARLIQHFNPRYALFTLAQRANGDCHYLDAQSRRCTIYALRPDTCRKHPETLGPRPGHCAYQQKA